MKTLKFLLIATAVSVTLSSCVDKIDHPTIGIGDLAIYVIQDGDDTFIPHIGYWYNGSEKLDHAEILKNGQSMDPDTYTALQICQIDLADHQTDDLESINGVYTLNPIGVNGGEWKREYELDFSNEQTLGEVVVTEFGYKNYKLYATFKKTDKAKKYGFYILPYEGGLLKYYALPISDFRFLAVTPGNVIGDEIKVEVDFSPYGIEELRIVPVAMNFSTDKYEWTLARIAAVHGDLRGTDHDKEKTFYTEPEE